jgi:ABC-type bacteriocin/lantibiotic exporter with double-glycine peptidase domain
LLFGDDGLRRLPCPSIVILFDSHAVVFEGYNSRENVVRFFETTRHELQEAPLEAFLAVWTRQAIVFAPLAESIVRQLLMIAASFLLTIGLSVAWKPTRSLALRSPCK